LKMYAECELKYENGQAFIDFIAENRHLLKGRPQSMQHGDFHIGNMMLDKSGQLVIIDFDRCDAGDPWEEFNRIVWCVQASQLFASGMTDGYFGVPEGGKVPLEFLKLLALYISSNTLSSLPWAIPFGEDEINTMTKQASEVLSWYNNMTQVVPTWYTENYGSCFCGHDCTRCVIYRAAVSGDEELSERADAFIKTELKRDIPICEQKCLGGRSDDVMRLCAECPFAACCRKRGIMRCEDCAEFPCDSVKEYREKYVNKCGQLL
nr:phosphotransferase [Clostridia bacterium]